MFNLFIEQWKNFIYVVNGIWYVLFFSYLSVFFGFLLGVCSAMIIEFYKNKFVKLLNLFCFFLRGTPILLQLFIVCFSLKKYIPLPKPILALMVLSFNSMSYFTESIRDNLKPILFQMETCKSLGFSLFQSIRYIFIPQITNNCHGLIKNEFCTMTKETSVLLNINIAEVMYRSRYISLQTFDWFYPSLYACFCYLIVIILSKKHAKYLSFCVRKILTYNNI